MAQVFQKRPGTTNKGVKYETLTVARMVMDLVTNDRVKEFHISSNNAGFGDFDDVVVETELDHGAHNYAFQLKHNDRGNLSLSQLTQPKGDFSISKYFSSWKSIDAVDTKFILFTNLRFNVADDTRLFLQGQEFPITVTKMYPQEAVKISDYCYRFSIAGDLAGHQHCPEISQYKRFFENFYLYANQENAHKLKLRVFEEFSGLFGGTRVECDQYVQFVDEWSLQDGTKEKLNKEWMRLVITLKIFASRIKPLSFDDGTTSTMKRDILREAIEAFGVTSFGKESYDQVKRLWVDIAKSEFNDLRTMNLLRTKYQLASAHISDAAKVDELTLSILLWLNGKCPLILVPDESTYKALEFCADKTIILLRDREDSFTNFFQTLSDLKRNSVQYARVIENFTVSLQGKEEIVLDSLIGDDEEILTFIRTDDLLQMLEGQCCIGGAREELSYPYIDRCLLKSAIDLKILDNLSKDSAVILDVASEDLRDLVKDRLKRHTLINIDDYLSVDHRKSEPMATFAQDLHAEASTLKTTSIYFSERRCGVGAFQAVGRRVKGVDNLHQFRFRDDLNLEWIRSRGDVNDIEKFKLTKYYSVQERDLGTHENNINLLVGDPGMGKSELMKSFKARCFSEFFTIIVDPKDVYAFLKNPSGYDYVDAFQNFLVDVKYKTFSERDKSVLRIFLKTSRIIYLWDALDELSDDHRDIVSNIILELSGDCVQWVTSRGHLQSRLQQKLYVLSINLTKFNINEQRNYIQKRLTGASLEEATEIIEKIESSFVLVEHKEILGIPLQLFMLTELFRRDREKYLALLNSFFALTDLYKYFIEEKFNIYHTEKLGMVVSTSFAELSVQNQNDQILKEHIEAALRLLLPEPILRHLNIPNAEDAQRIHQSHGNIGLVIETKDQLQQFIHNSFAEYLGARFFASNLQHQAILLEVMFDPKYNNVRFFFDLLLAKDSEAHIAVLYKNFRFLTNCDGDALRETDSGGRSPLHLACSWGQRYPDLEVRYVGDAYVVEAEGKLEGTVSESGAYLETFDRLLNECDGSQCDHVFNMTPKEYARRSTCMAAEIRMTMKQDTGASFEMDHALSMLYYSVYHDQSHECAFLLEHSKRHFMEPNDPESEIVETRNPVIDLKNEIGKTLVYLAAELGYFQMVKLLVEAGADSDLPDEYGWTPLSIASWHRREAIVDFLVKTGADVNLAGDDWTPLCITCSTGNEKLAEFLVKAGGAVNLLRTDGATPLYIASASGHEKMVEFLLEEGADPNLAGAGKWAPLSIAAAKGYDKVVEFLLKGGAVVDRSDEDGWTPLSIACSNGHEKIVECLIKAGAAANRASKSGATPLYIASSNGHERIVELLVKKGVNVNSTKKNLSSPLYVACDHGHEKTVECLVKSGAAVNQASKTTGATPLYIASSNGDERIVELLVKAGAKMNLAHTNGVTPLYIAAWNGHVKVVECLTKTEATCIDRANKKGATPLYAASLTGHEKTVECLIKAGAAIDLANKDGATPLYISCAKGHGRVVEVLVKGGANVIMATKRGVTPLHVASWNGHEEVVELLLKSRARFDLAKRISSPLLYIASENSRVRIVECLVKAGADTNRVYKNGWTPLSIACWNGHEKVVEILVRSGADTNRANTNKATPLFIASQNGHEKIVELLVKEGADVNRTKKHRPSALFIAAETRHEKIVDFLIRAGADCNLPGKHGWAPLTIASWSGHEMIVKLLVQGGADINLSDKDGVTPLYVASQNGHKGVVEFLLAEGADFNLARKDGSTPHSIASQNGHVAVVDLLVRAGAQGTVKSYCSNCQLL